MEAVNSELEFYDDANEADWEQEIAARVKRLDEGKSHTVDWREAHKAIRRKLRENKE